MTFHCEFATLRERERDKEGSEQAQKESEETEQDPRTEKTDSGPAIIEGRRTPPQRRTGNAEMTTWRRCGRGEPYRVT